MKLQRTIRTKQWGYRTLMVALLGVATMSAVRTHAHNWPLAMSSHVMAGALSAGLGSFMYKTFDKSRVIGLTGAVMGFAAGHLLPRSLHALAGVKKDTSSASEGLGFCAGIASFTATIVCLKKYLNYFK